MVERYVRDVEVAGSNPVTPIFYREPQSSEYTALRFLFCFSILLLLYEDQLLVMGFLNMSTNEYHNHGAVGMFRLNLLKKFAEQIQQDFYILPSSVNEGILLSDSSNKSPDFLRLLVQKNNRNYISQEGVKLSA